jgi:hypothetical protein
MVCAEDVANLVRKDSPGVPANVVNPVEVVRHACGKTLAQLANKRKARLRRRLVCTRIAIVKQMPECFVGRHLDRRIHTKVHQGVPEICGGVLCALSVVPALGSIREV